MEKPKGKVTKSCARCRKHKTRCDQLLTRPLPCTNCAKKNLDCILDVIAYNPNRKSSDIVEKLDLQVKSLKRTVDNLIYRKSLIIDLLAKQNPSISEIQNCLETEEFESDNEEFQNDSNGDFVVSIDDSTPTISLLMDDAVFHFNNYFENYHKFLPILPESFYEESNISKVYQGSQLLFWSIILTSSLNTDFHQQYLYLSKHVKKLVVDNCWINTPRSVYVLASLLILTTWPIPLSGKEKINDNVSIKYLSLMKNLSLQLGLHRLEFIDEFLHKTLMNITSEVDLNNVIRERIYKFITINSNYWLTNLGLMHLNFNGFQEDFIINKAYNENQNTSNNSPQDKYINSLLKLSIIQQRLHENLNIHHNPSKLIHLHMFEVILNDLSSKKSKIIHNNLTKLSIEYSKLQLYLYAFDASLRLPLNDYRRYVYKALESCFTIIDIIGKEFPNLYSVNQLPIHFKFIIELVVLVLTKIYYSPFLSSVDQYESLKSKFASLYNLMNKNQSNWNFFYWRFLKTVNKFNDIHKHNLLGKIKQNRSIYFLNKFTTHQVANIYYEMIWSIYSSYKYNNNDNDSNDNEITWESFGIRDEKLIKYLDNISLI